MEQPMEFWGVEVKAGQSVKVDPDDQCPGYIFISQVALGEGKKDEASEPVVLSLKVADLELVIGTLTKDSITQTTLNIVLNMEFELSHDSENASVHFSGFKVVCGYDDDSDSSDSEPEPEEESESDFSGSDISLNVENDTEESESEEETPASENEESESEEETPASESEEENSC